MTEKTLPLSAAPAKRSAFAVDEALSDAHIVDVLIEERCPTWRGHWTWPAVRPLLYKTLGYRRAVRVADHLMALNGRDSFNYLAGELAIQLSVRGQHHLPASGKVIIAANHPTGLADGIAVWDLIKRTREDMVFFANADAVRVNEKFEDVIIPVEWVMDKRSPAKARETLRRASEAFKAGKCVVIFPSGRLARWVDGKLWEQDWFSTVVGLAKKQKATVIPLNVSARNSRLFYALSKINGELRDITLFHELLNKKGARFDFTFGAPIAPEALQGDANAVTEALKTHVAYTLKNDPAAMFQQIA